MSCFQGLSSGAQNIVITLLLFWHLVTAQQNYVRYCHQEGVFVNGTVVTWVIAYINSS